MFSLMYVGAYIVADRYIRRYMHLPSNLPTFARPPIYRAKIVPPSGKSRKSGFRAARIRAASGFRSGASPLHHYFMRKFIRVASLILSFARSLARGSPPPLSPLFRVFFPRKEKSPRYGFSLFRALARIIRARAASNEFARIHVARVVAPNCESAPDRIASG